MEVLFVLLLLIIAGLWLFAFLDILRTPPDSFKTGSQLIWSMTVLILPLVGPMLYIIVERDQRARPSQTEALPDPKRGE